MRRTPANTRVESVEPLPWGMPPQSPPERWDVRFTSSERYVLEPDDISEFVEGLFWSDKHKGLPRGRMVDHWKMVSAIANDAIVVRQYTYDPPWDDLFYDPAPHFPCHDDFVHWHECHSGTGGKEHSCIRYFAMQWIWSLGDPSPEIEDNYAARIRADLASRPLGLIAEIGNTNPRYPFLAFDSGFSRYAVFPFWEWRGPTFFTLAKGDRYDEWAPLWESHKGKFEQ